MAKANPTTNAGQQAALAANPVATPVVTQVQRLALVGTAQYVVLGSKRGLTGGNQPKYGSNNANTLAALQAAQGTNATIPGTTVASVLKANKHTDFFGYAVGRGWLALAPTNALSAGPL